MLQSIVLENVLITNLFGSSEDNGHNCTVLYDSGLLQDPQRVAWFSGHPRCICSDPACPVCICKNHIDKETTHQMNYKDEWIKGDNKFVHFKTLLKIGSVAKIYLMCGLLQNARTKDPVTVKE